MDFDGRRHGSPREVFPGHVMNMHVTWVTPERLQAVYPTRYLAVLFLVFLIGRAERKVDGWEAVSWKTCGHFRGGPNRRVGPLWSGQFLFQDHVPWSSQCILDGVGFRTPKFYGNPVNNKPCGLQIRTYNCGLARVYGVLNSIGMIYWGTLDTFQEQARNEWGCIWLYHLVERVNVSRMKLSRGRSPDS